MIGKPFSPDKYFDCVRHGTLPISKAGAQPDFASFTNVSIKAGSWSFTTHPATNNMFFVRVIDTQDFDESENDDDNNNKNHYNNTNNNNNNNKNNNMISYIDF